MELAREELPLSWIKAWKLIDNWGQVSPGLGVV